MSVNNVTGSLNTSTFSSQIGDNSVDNIDIRPQPLNTNLTDSTLSPGRAEVLTKLLHKMQNKFDNLRNIVSNIDFEENTTDPEQVKKNDRRDKCFVYLACVPGIGTGINVFKEKDIAEKLKKAIDPAEKHKLLKKQKDFRVSALIRTVISVALAIILVAIAIFTGGASVALGLGLMGAALALGSGFSGYYANLLRESNAKLKPLDEAQRRAEAGETATRIEGQS